MITKLRQLFDCLFTKAKGGNINPGIRIAFNVNGYWATIVEDGDYKLRQNNIYLYLKSIQHGETQKAFFLQIFIPEGDLELWNDLLEK